MGVGTGILDFGNRPSVVGSGSQASATNRAFVRYGPTAPGLLLVAIAHTTTQSIVNVVANNPFPSIGLGYGTPTVALQLLRTVTIGTAMVELWVSPFPFPGTTGSVLTVDFTGGVDQATLVLALKDATGVRDHDAVAVNAVDPADVTVDSRESDVVADFVFAINAAPFTPGAGQTEVLDQGGAGYSGAASTKPGAVTSTTMSYTDTPAGAHDSVHVAASLKCSPAEEAVVTISGQAGLVSTSHIEAWFQHGDVTADNGAEQHAEAAMQIPLACKWTVDGSFEVRAMALATFATGMFKFHYAWSN